MLRQAKKFIKKIIFKLINPTVLYFDPVKSDSPYYSQAGQDKILHKYLINKVRTKTFVDIGANDPFLLSNSAFFERSFDWSGYAFDPQPDLDDSWLARPRTNFQQLALGAKNERREFYQRVGGAEWENMLSSFEPMLKSDPNFKSISVEVRRFDSWALENGVSDIGILFLDVEGHELAVLQGISFETIRVDVVVVENNTRGGAYLGDGRIRKHLKKSGFRYWGRIIGFDDIFVSEKAIV